MTMHATRQTRPQMHVIGRHARTTNREEAAAASARIPGLWAQVEGVVQAVGPGRLCAVYHDYESDHDGVYSIVVGVEVADQREAPTGLVTVTAPAAECMAYEAHGEMPEALIAAWRQVWSDYPSGSDGRAYTSDVEVHAEHGPDLYIAVTFAG